MSDWTSIWRDFCEQPAAAPFLGVYYKFMNIRRYDHMPFYIYPQAKSWVSFEDTILTFLDWLVDAHELERNKSDAFRSFYQRSLYLYENFFRYANDTHANLQYDTKLHKYEYDRLNSVSSVAHAKFYAATTAFHTLSFTYMAWFFRFRRVGIVPVFAVSSAYYFAFTKINNAAYKWLVDRPIIATARNLGHGAHV